MSSIAKLLSYPPAFRPTHLPDPLNYRPYNPVSHSDPFPVIDMANLDKTKLHAACSDWGIFRVVNHGIPEELITRLRESTKSSFDLPFETKREVFTKPNPVYTWGNSALPRPGVKIPAGFPEVGVEILGFALAPRRHFDDGGENVVVNSLRYALEEYGEHMTILAKELFQLMASNLKLDQNLPAKGDMNKYLDVSTGLLRVNRYLPCSTSDADTQIVGLGPHTDSSVFTILLQDDVHGLEVRDDNGLWVPVKPIPNTLLVNIGDMLQAMSNDEYKSAEHKVMLNEHCERISVGYFVFPEASTLLTKSNGKYRPFTSKEFMAQVEDDVAKNGWKVGLSRFLD